jgi:hypothetical protein
MFIVFLETPGSSPMADADPLAFLTMVIARYPNLPDITGFSNYSATATGASYTFYSSYFFLYFSAILRSAKFFG